MSRINFFKTTAAPTVADAVPNSVYLVKPVNSETAEIYITSDDSTPEIVASQVQGPEGPAGTTKSLFQLDFSGRYHLYPDGRWVTQDPGYGVSTENYSSSAGTGTNASLDSDVSGAYVKAGDKIISFTVEAELNSLADFSQISVQVWLKGTGASGGTTLLHESRNVPMSGSKSQVINVQRSQSGGISIPSDGKILVAVRPESHTGTSTRYCYAAIAARILSSVPE